MKVSNWIHYSTASVFQILRSLTPSANHQLLDLGSRFNQEVDSTLLVILLMELSAFRTENAEAVFAIISNALHHQLIHSATMTVNANQTNSVTMESAQTSGWDLSYLIALRTMIVPILVSAMMTLFVSHTPLLDQVERIHSAAMTVNANQINSVTMDSAQTLEWDFSFQDKKETLVK